jgi:hypothetical protein
MRKYIAVPRVYLYPPRPPPPFPRDLAGPVLSNMSGLDDPRAHPLAGMAGASL